MGAFDNAEVVMINNKEVESIKTNDGRVIYQRPVAIVAGNDVTIGYNNINWLTTIGDVIINWGDGTTDTVNNPTTRLSHIYTDGEQSHSIVFFGNVTSLGYRCFDNCIGLTSVTIPSSVTSLGSACFRRCSNLTSITIPLSVTSIENNCFMDCINLNTYQLYWTDNNIITYNGNKMPNYTNTKFYVPQGQKTNYVNKGYPSDKVVERSS